MLRSLLCVGALVLCSAAAHSAPITFTFKGTVLNETPFAGYTSGQTVIATYTFSSPVSTVVSDFGSGFYYWDDTGLSDPAAYLFSSITVTGLTGALDKAAGVGDFITINEGASPMLAVNSDRNGAPNIGFYADGIGVTALLMQGWVDAPFVFGPEPVTLEYFAAYLGTYAITSLGPGSYSSIMVEGDRHVYLDITEVTIAAIPEPSTALALVSGSAALFLLRRRRK